MNLLQSEVKTNIVFKALKCPGPPLMMEYSQ